MLVILLEALLALAILVAMVWWTMFSGRARGELRDAAEHDAESARNDASADANDTKKRR